MPVGNLEFIKSASGTSVSSLSVTDCFSADYDVYFISITDLKQASGGTLISYRYLDSSNTPITSAVYDKAALVVRSGSAFGQSRSTNQTYGLDLNAYAHTGTQGIGNSIYIINPYDSASYSFALAQTAHYESGAFAGYKAIGVMKSAQQCNGIEFSSSSANFDNITVNVFGVK